MPDVYELTSIYNKIEGSEDDFVAIGLYRKIADEGTLRFYYQLITTSRNGYIEDPKAGQIMKAFFKRKWAEFKKYWHEYALYWLLMGIQIGAALVAILFTISISIFGLCEK